MIPLQEQISQLHRMIIPALPFAHRSHCTPSSSSKRLSRSSIISVELEFFFPNEYCCCYHSPPLPELSSSYRPSADPSRPIRVRFCVHLLHTTALRTSETNRNSNPTFNSPVATRGQFPFWSRIFFAHREQIDSTCDARAHIFEKQNKNKFKNKTSLRVECVHEVKSL